MLTGVSNPIKMSNDVIDQRRYSSPSQSFDGARDIKYDRSSSPCIVGRICAFRLVETSAMQALKTPLAYAVVSGIINHTTFSVIPDEVVVRM